MRRKQLRGLALVAALLCAGCYGSLDPNTVACTLGKPDNCPDNYVCRGVGPKGQCCKSDDLTCGGLDGATSAGVDTQASHADSSGMDQYVVDTSQDRGFDSDREVPPPTFDAPIDSTAQDIPLGTGGADDAAGTGGQGGGGGVTGTGGHAVAGGASGTGGMPGAGGIVSSGGIPGTGGIPGEGGVVGSGGITANGGVVGSGGATGTGGTSASGGISGSGATLGTGGTGPAAAILNFTATPMIISAFRGAPQSSTLTWSMDGTPTSLTIDQGVGSVLGTTSKLVSPFQTTTYTLTLNGSVTKQATVTVVPLPSITNFLAIPTIVGAGGSATLCDLLWRSGKCGP